MKPGMKLSLEKTPKSILLVVLLFSLFACNKDEEPGPTELFSYCNIEEQEIAGERRYTNQVTELEYTGWGVYEDIIFSGTAIEWSMKHEEMDEKAVLACAITGGDAYNNVFFTNTVAIAWEELAWPYKNVKSFEYSLDFYIEGELNCDSPNESTLEGIEFTWQHVIAPDSYGFGVQYSKGGEWRYWEDEIDPESGKPNAWQSFSPAITGCLATKVWNQLVLQGEVFENGIRYTSMTLNGNEFDLSSAIVGTAKIPDSWVENFLQVGVQLNGNKAIDLSHGEGVDPVTVYLDKVNLALFE